MPTIPQRIASAFAVFCGQYGDVTEMAKGREQSRQSLYREAEQVANAVNGAAAQARIDEQQLQMGPDRLGARLACSCGFGYMGGGLAPDLNDLAALKLAVALLLAPPHEALPIAVDLDAPQQ